MLFGCLYQINMLVSYFLLTTAYKILIFNSTADYAFDYLHVFGHRKVIKKIIFTVRHVYSFPRKDMIIVIGSFLCGKGG